MSILKDLGVGPMSLDDLPIILCSPSIDLSTVPVIRFPTCIRDIIKS
jgi:hypothetical protein